MVSPVRAAAPAASRVPDAIIDSSSTPVRIDRYTVPCTSATAAHGAIRAMGAASHHPVTAQATAAAAAAFSDCTTR